MTNLSMRQVLVGGRPAGMLGLDEVFETLYEQGRRPEEPDLGIDLVTQARAHNYIPKPAVADYAEALLREYRQYVAQRAGGERPRRVNYGTWRGHPREHIPWFPTVAADLCNGCGVCLKLCGPGALASTPDGKVEVVDSFKCVVGCSSCASVCKPGAITFPPREILDAWSGR
jgi:ferredoxin